MTVVPKLQQSPPPTYDERIVVAMARNAVKLVGKDAECARYGEYGADGDDTPYDNGDEYVEHAGCDGGTEDD
eukprot:15382167-Alexandrium_andersonii.AAC.1